MKINYLNEKEVEKIYVHDAFFEVFQYNYIEKEIVIKLNNIFINKQHECLFKEVIYCEIIGTELWGQVERIIDWEIIENSEKLNELLIADKTADFDYINSLFRRKPEIKYVTTKFTLNSGDVIIIICEEINVEEIK